MDARQCTGCGYTMPPYVPRTRRGGDMLCAGCADRPRGGYVSAAKASLGEDHESYYHITDNPHFAPKADYSPHDNSLSISDRTRPGLYLTKDPNRWGTAQGYQRPYLAEVHVPKGVGGGERFGDEHFVEGKDLDKVKVHRVIPLDEHIREQYGEPGRIETFHGTSHDGRELVKGPWGQKAFKEPLGEGYRYSGPDVRDMSPQQHRQHYERWRDYATAGGIEGFPFGHNEFDDEKMTLRSSEPSKHDFDDEGQFIMRDRHGNETGRKWASRTAHPLSSFESFVRQAGGQHPLIAEHVAKFGVAHTCLGRRLDLGGRRTAAEAEDAINGELHESGEFGPLSHEEQEKRLADTKMWVPHKAFAPADIARQGASGYASRLHLPDPHLHSYEGIRTSTSNLRDIGRAYDNLPLHDPGAVPAFEAMRDEVRKQHDHMTNVMGIKTEVVDHDPYPTVQHMVHDVVNNKRIKVLSTKVTGGHQFMSDEDNDKFRAVHDVFGHAATGRAFDAHGEEAAWLAHSRMFTPDARPAMSSETRGQNSALHINGTFQAQKTAILPRHMWDDSAVRSHASREPLSFEAFVKKASDSSLVWSSPGSNDCPHEHSYPEGCCDEHGGRFEICHDCGLNLDTGEYAFGRHASRKVAHDSGDGETIYHCPFCGSGQVIARSDRTIECSFCHTCFTVQVQPQYSAFPQTVNGVPVDVPGMPGQIGADPAQDPAMGADPTDPNADPAAAGAIPGQDPAEPDADGDSDDGDDDKDGGNPFAKGSALRTASGAVLDPQAYLAHLALAHSDDRQQTLAAVRGDR